jgi:hypothetical protein
MAFNKTYGDILFPFVDNYKVATNEKTRALVIKNAVDAVINSRHLLEDTGIDLPKDLKTVCPFSLCIISLLSLMRCQAVTRYIKGQNEKEAAVDSGVSKPKKTKKFYTIRDVIKQHYADRVGAQIPYKPNEKEYIGSYQRAVTTVLKNMTENDLEEAEKIVESWNAQGAPAEVQLK